MSEIKGFIKSKNVKEILKTGLKSSMNVVLHGKGGYGKSEMALAFLSQEGIEEKDIIVKSLSVGTMLDDLLGGLNIKTIQETGFQEYNTNLSIFSKPYLILEEAFDAPVRVLEGLKDILTSKKIRNGLQTYDIKTKFVIVCTNRAKETIAKDVSSMALMERFPLSYEVQWDKHRVSDYKKLIKSKGFSPNQEFDMVIKYVLESISETEDQPPSPRAALGLYRIITESGLSGARFLDGMPNVEHAVKWIAENSEKAEEEEAKKEKKLQIQEAIRGLVQSFIESSEKLTDDTPISEYKALAALQAKLIGKTSENDMENEFKLLKSIKL